LPAGAAPPLYPDAVSGSTRQEDPSLREHKRRAVQDELSLTAIDLFIERGFEATSVQQIAAAAGMSTRTFFRYFRTKDDVLGHRSERWRRQIGQALAERPVDEPVWESLRRVFDEYLEVTLEEGRALPLLQAIYASPAHHGQLLHRMELLGEELAAVLRDRLRGRGEDPELVAPVLAGTVVACLEVARRHWVATGGTERYDALLDATMSLVEPVRRGGSRSRADGSA
jgi:AcrR family transcriptional regulator